MTHNFGDDIKKVFLAGIGAVALTAEKTKELIDKLVEKGSITAEQGKKLAEKLIDKGKVTTGQSRELVANLVNRGKITAEQGKELMADITKKGEMTFEETKKFFAKLVEKGEVTVDAGKALNDEIKKNLEKKRRENQYNAIVKNLKDLDQDQIDAIKKMLDEMDA